MPYCLQDGPRYTLYGGPGAAVVEHPSPRGEVPPGHGDPGAPERGERATGGGAGRSHDDVERAERSRKGLDAQRVYEPSGAIRQHGRAIHGHS